MRQMTGDILSLGSELFLSQSHMELKRISSNRLDLKLLSVNENDSGIYTCMFNDEKLQSFFIEILGKFKQMLHIDRREDDYMACVYLYLVLISFSFSSDNLDRHLYKLALMIHPYA